MVCETLT